MHIVIIGQQWEKNDLTFWNCLVSALIAFLSFFFQHRESVKDPVSSTDHPRYRGRGDRLLSRPRPVWALSQGGGAPLGGGSRSQRHWALQSVPGEATALHQPGPGCTACLRNKQQPLCGCMNETVRMHVCETEWERQHVCKVCVRNWPKTICDFFLSHLCVFEAAHLYVYFSTQHMSG